MVMVELMISVSTVYNGYTSVRDGVRNLNGVSGVIDVIPHSDQLCINFYHCFYFFNKKITALSKSWVWFWL